MKNVRMTYRILKIGDMKIMFNIKIGGVYVITALRLANILKCKHEEVLEAFKSSKANILKTLPYGAELRNNGTTMENGYETPFLDLDIVTMIIVHLGGDRATDLLINLMIGEVVVTNTSEDDGVTEMIEESTIYKIEKISDKDVKSEPIGIKECVDRAIPGLNEKWSSMNIVESDDTPSVDDIAPGSNIVDRGVMTMKSFTVYYNENTLIVKDKFKPIDTAQLINVLKELRYIPITSTVAYHKYVMSNIFSIENVETESGSVLVTNVTAYGADILRDALDKHSVE